MILRVLAYTILGGVLLCTSYMAATGQWPQAFILALSGVSFVAWGGLRP